MSTQKNATPQPAVKSSREMLEHLSSRLGKDLGLGGSSRLAVLKTNETPDDAVLEAALEEIQALQGQGQKDPIVTTKRLLMIKRFVDCVLLFKANPLEKPASVSDQVQSLPETVATLPLTTGGSTMKNAIDVLDQIAGTEPAPADPTAPATQPTAPATTPTATAPAAPAEGEVAKKGGTVHKFSKDLNSGRRAEKNANGRRSTRVPS